MAALLSDLGYPAAAGVVMPRLDALKQERSTRVVVAEREGTLVGLATGHAFFAVHVDHVIAYLTALVVAPGARRSGVGRGLVEDIAKWAGDQGAERLSVVTGIQRADAQGFYERLGFELTAQRYSKRLRNYEEHAV